MRGIWKPYSNSINGKMMWIAGRRLDESVPLHSGNIETHGGYSEVKENVEAICRKLNEKEKATNRQKEILEAWERIEEADPDISTERLFALVEEETGADAGDISTALYEEHLKENNKEKAANCWNSKRLETKKHHRKNTT